MSAIGFYETYDARFQFPFSAVIAGPSLSGKTTFLTKLLEQTQFLISEKIDLVVWFYGVKTPSLAQLEQKFSRNWFKTIQGLPDVEHLEQYGITQDKKALFVLDDLAQEAANCPLIVVLLNNYVHHKNICVFLVLQDLFCPGRFRTTFLKNVHYLILFRNPLDNNIARIISHRFMPQNVKVFMDIYNEVFKQPFSYLLLDGHQRTDNNLRLRTDIFGLGQTVFIPKGK